MRLETRNLSFDYRSAAGGTTVGIRNVNMEFPEGKVTAIMGESGSGKSTLVRLLNGLSRPSSGHVLADGKDIWEKNYDRYSLRARVGVVFQFAENQLFEETVIKDVMYGPLNIGMTEKEARESAIRALSLLGLGKEYHERSPFSLSGGEKRRVALAGVISMNPEVLVLDEIAAGLDAESHDRVLSLLDVYRNEGRTVIFVTHSADDAAEAGDVIVYLEHGEVKISGDVRDVFSSGDIPLPQAEMTAGILREKGMDLKYPILTMDELVEAVCGAADNE